MRRNPRKPSTFPFPNAGPVNKKTAKARAKVEALRDYLRDIQTTEALQKELNAGLKLDWEGLRSHARCGSDALHRNNPDLKDEVEKEKNRLERLWSQYTDVGSIRGRDTQNLDKETKLAQRTRNSFKKTRSLSSSSTGRI